MIKNTGGDWGVIQWGWTCPNCGQHILNSTGHYCPGKREPYTQEVYSWPPKPVLTEEDKEILAKAAEILERLAKSA